MCSLTKSPGNLRRYRSQAKSTAKTIENMDPGKVSKKVDPRPAYQFERKGNPQIIELHFPDDATVKDSVLKLKEYGFLPPFFWEKLTVLHDSRAVSISERLSDICANSNDNLFLIDWGQREEDHQFKTLCDMGFVSPEMKSKISTPKISFGRFASLKELPEPQTFYEPPGVRQRQPDPEPDGSLIHNLASLNTFLTKSVASLTGQKETMSERIEYLQSSVVKNKELVENLRGRILQLSAHGETSSQNEELTEANSITPSTVIDFLQSKPVILQAFLGTSFHAFTEMAEILDNETLVLFVDYSLKQLERISECFECFGILSTVTRQRLFIDTVCDCAKRVFNSKTCFLFIKDSKTGNLSCFFGGRETQIALRGTESMIANAVEQQKVVFYTDPQSSSLYSPSLDPLFNPENNPVILIPIGKVAVIYVVHTDPLSFSFTNEDRDVGEFFSAILEPLIQDHLQYANITKQANGQLILNEFEMQIEKKVWFLELIPFLSESLFENVGAQCVELFFYNGEEFFSYEVEEQGLVERQHEYAGVVRFVYDKKYYCVADKLNQKTVPSFDERVDKKWANEPCGFFPICLHDGEVLGVIVISEPKDGQKFNEWDVEFMNSACTVLSLVIPRCRENERNAAGEQFLKDLKEMPAALTKFNETNMCDGMRYEKDIVIDIAKCLEEVLKSEYVAFYDKNCECIGAVRNGNAFDGAVIDKHFAQVLFESGDVVNCVDASCRTDYSGVDCNAFIAASCQGVHVIALNATTRFGRFDKLHEGILVCFCAFLANSLCINSLKATIREGEAADETAKNALKNVATAAVTKEDFESLMEGIRQSTSMEHFCVFQRVNMGHKFNVICSSIENIPNSIPDSDALASKLKECTKVRTFSASDFSRSSFLDLFHGSSVFIVAELKTNEVFVLLSGSNPAHDSEMFLSFIMPIANVFLENYSLRKKPEIQMVTEINKLSLEKPESRAGLLESSEFVASNCSSTQKTHTILLILERLKITEFLGVDVLVLTELIKSFESGYNNSLKYHNWDHAINVTQMISFMLIKTGVVEYFTPLELTALIFAALCHDLKHPGISSATMIKYNTSMSYTFGILSPLERRHVFEGTQIIMKSPISDKLNCQEFWNQFSSFIFATDITRREEVLVEFRGIVNSFDQTNEKHRFALGRILILMSNISNFTRPFEEYFKMCENLEIEERGELEYIRSHSKDEPIPAPIPLIQKERAFLRDVATPIAQELDKFAPSLSLCTLIARADLQWEKRT